MKKLIALTLSLSLVLTSLIGFGTPVKTKASGTKQIMLELKPALNKVKLKWPKKKGVSYYTIHKVTVTKKVVKDDYYIAKKKYKKVAKVSGKKTSFKDKSVKTNKRYAYFIQGYKKKGSKSTLKYTSYTEIYNDAYTGLDKPTIFRYYSDNFENDAHVAYFHLSYGTGINPTKTYVYRKAADEKSYTKFKFKAMPNSDDDPLVYCANKLRSNIKYTFKVKTYYKKGKKKYSSKYSSTYKITPCNSSAKFFASTPTPAGTSVQEFVVKLSGDVDNGKTTFHYYNNSEDDLYHYTDTSNVNSTYMVAITEYSYDGIVWKSLKNTTVSTKSNEIIYLKFKMSKLEDDTTPYYNFGANNKNYSQLDLVSSITYYGPNNGSTNGRIDLVDGTAMFHQYND